MQLKMNVIHIIFNFFSVNLLVADLEEVLQQNLDTEEKVTSDHDHLIWLHSCASLLFMSISLEMFPPFQSRHISCLTLEGNPSPISYSNHLNQKYTSSCKLLGRSQPLVEYGKTSSFCQGLWEKHKLERSNYHRKVKFQVLRDRL